MRTTMPARLYGGGVPQFRLPRLIESRALSLEGCGTWFTDNEDQTCGVLWQVAVVVPNIRINITSLSTEQKWDTLTLVGPLPQWSKHTGLSWWEGKAQG